MPLVALRQALKLRLALRLPRLPRASVPKHVVPPSPLGGVHGMHATVAVRRTRRPARQRANRNPCTRSHTMLPSAQCRYQPSQKQGMCPGSPAQFGAQRPANCAKLYLYNSAIDFFAPSTPFWSLSTPAALILCELVHAKWATMSFWSDSWQKSWRM